MATTSLTVSGSRPRFGRGYPSPSTQFRWCTDRLKIHPVSNFIKSVADRVREAA
jgi:3'-phosphoadenosine 5'-phosphosulfate sulfotransferase (PAPS reductase)/FAD synthetase